MRLSYTAISDFLKCPKMFSNRYIDKRQEVAGTRLLEGRIAHKNIEEGKIPEFFKEVFEKKFIGPHLEEKKEFKFLGYEFVGVIDAYSVSGATCYIADWKLFGLPENDLQLKFYAWLLTNTELKGVQWFTGYYVSIEGKFFKRYDFTADDVVEFERGLVNIIEEIEESKFEPRFGSWCEHCPFLVECYSEANIEVAKGVFSVRTIEEAQELAGKVMLADNFLKVIKEKLKNFMLSEGIEELDCGEFRMKLVPSVALRFYSNKRRK